MTRMDRVKQAQRFVEYAYWLGQGVHYRWGGDDPMTGFDCSGFVIECLRSCGMYPMKGDEKAEDLYHRFADCHYSGPTSGCLVFYAKEGEICHVGIYVGYGQYLSAEGGGSGTNNAEDAAKHNAFVRVRPVDSRSVPPIYCDIFRLSD